MLLAEQSAFHAGGHAVYTNSMKKSLKLLEVLPVDWEEEWVREEAREWQSTNGQSERREPSRRPN